MANIISIVNQKGGVGKTTTTHNLGYALAEQDKNTLIMDLDPQMNLSNTVGIDCYAQKQSIYDVLKDKELPLGSVIKSSDHERMDIIPSAFELSGAEIEFTRRISSASLLSRSITNSIREEYDFIIIDCPPALGILTINALSASDYVIIPMQAEVYALYGIDMLLSTIEEIQEETNSDLKIMGVLITMHDGRLRLHKEMTEKINDYFKDKVFDTLIKTNTTLKEAQSNSKSIFEYDGRARGAKNYEALAREVIEICQTREVR
ncbi:ParA family protein [Halarsenatibacter silvermanii]|uniref:Sporulation initiation inhibitor protein Soj n=1 Tax=Halarsenatibacter silvermanii TaxID=321763 RepID=A0A1G9MXN7_9FIRM|nr:ParA family protein [Halarsenatibacter silvermanii]SDL79066.1 chromosome partitioning protein [Halarsenatibacter silvermanii]